MKGATHLLQGGYLVVGISIHAPVKGATKAAKAQTTADGFQSTLP